MDSTLKDQTAITEITPRSILRYPLRSATKVKEETWSSSRRGIAAPKVNQSVSCLELYGKDKSAKTPCRLSNFTKSTVSASPKSIGTITPRSNVGQGKTGTPSSAVSKSLIKRKFNILASTSYWLTQIKLSESVGKHMISLGFFKLALEAGCEPLQRMRDELKAYALRTNLTGYGDSVNELLKSYNVSEDLEQLQVSQTCSHVPEEDVNSCTSSATPKTWKLKPKSLNSESYKSSAVADSTNEGAKKRTPAKNKVSSNNSHVKPQRASSRQKANKERETSENKENIDNKSGDELDPVEVSSVEDKKQDAKENVAQQMEEISLSDVVV
ncbi:hypothetical protein MKW94_000617 [Papaver nudicaule]|uniref:Uncharacterized protein n=1 Tax=Papaver nudicaule TaxID=74823 RepID=A0AA41S163_PAPNU|nr:hypothetical protein [Papaver nudicaule]